MRRHAKASSAGSKLRKPSGHGASPPSGRLRLTILLATVAAFLLVPVAQAAAAAPTLKVNITGSGAGEVTGEPGEPSNIECSYASPGPATGNCATTMVEVEPEFFAIILSRAPSAGSGFTTKWSVEGGFSIGGCANVAAECLVGAAEGEEVKVTTAFVKVQPLTVEKVSFGEATGEGTVVSSPAGIECGTSCSSETHSFEENALVTLTANPASGSVFTSWTGCVKTVEGTGAKGHVCTVQMSKALTVKSKFTKVMAITGAKDSAGNGFGTVTSAPGGISCGPTCSSATALFTYNSTVTVKAAPVASTSVFAGWAACPGTEEGASCKVVASEAKTAKATFNLIAQFALTLTKSGGGTGTVSSVPAGISCGPTCSSAVGKYNSGKEVTLKEVPLTGSTFGGWSGACSGTGECKVTMSSAKSVGAEFK